MITKTCSAWLLHQKPEGDSSCRCTFISLEEGLISAKYKGARTAKKKASLQLFTPLNISLQQRQERLYINHVELAAASLPLSGKALFSGLYLNELLYYLLKTQEPQPEIVEAYGACLSALSRAGEQSALEIALREFELLLLHSLGYFTAFDQEADSFQPLSARQNYSFIPGRGFVPAAQGYPGAVLLAIAAGAPWDKSMLMVAKQVMRLALDSLLEGRPLRSRALFNASAGNEPFAGSHHSN